MASVCIVARTTSKGVKRWVVRYRRGGRRTPQIHAGSFKTLAEAEKCRDKLRTQLVATVVERAVERAKRDDRKLVYFGRLGDMIEIGVSVNPVARCRELNAELLRAEPGGRGREADLHNVFRQWRVSGEWFHAAPPILSYIEHSQTAENVPSDRVVARAG